LEMKRLCGRGLTRVKPVRQALPVLRGSKDDEAGMVQRQSAMRAEERRIPSFRSSEERQCFIRFAPSPLRKSNNET
jgi:hypothetical protein